MIKFQCDPDGSESFVIEADSRDVIAWEVRKAGRHLGMIQNTPRMSDLSELAWLAAKRQKAWTGDLAEFRLEVAIRPLADEDPDEDAGLLDPTQPGA